jgi:branched-chain amino acid transport system substrate-binding protein
VKIGVLFPLTGNAAAAGQASKRRSRSPLDIINNAHPELGNMPLAATAGLPNLGGAKLDVVFVDHQGNPSMAQQLATRLITRGQGQCADGRLSVVLHFTATAGRRALRHSLHGRRILGAQHHHARLQIRVSRHADRYRLCAGLYALLRRHEESRARRSARFAIVNENTDYGTSVGDAIEAEAKKADLPVAIRIPYSASSTDVSAQVLQLKQANPDVVIFISYTADAILYMKTMKSLDYKPPMVIGDDTGFSDPSFIPAVSDIAQGVMNRSAWAIGKPGSTTDKINDDVQGQDRPRSRRHLGAQHAGFLALADAINRAGSTDPEKIRDALTKTDLKPDQLMMGYQGVKFDETGQNILASTYLIQLHGKSYDMVWPEQAATDKLQWPMEARRNSGRSAVAHWANRRWWFSK